MSEKGGSSSSMAWEWRMPSCSPSRDLADYFENCLQRFEQPKQVCNWVTGPLLAMLNTREMTIAASPVSPEMMAALLELIDKGTISGKIAKTVFEEMGLSGKMPGVIVEEKGLTQVSDAGAIGTIVEEVLAGAPEEVALYRGGKHKLMGFFVGQVMKATRGKANPGVVNKLLKEKLEQEG
jgi:aspartyl-tRNA(Asn)/glutamyl-tRNA(Gln) amidotransferase subunit B